MREIKKDKKNKEEEKISQKWKGKGCKYEKKKVISTMNEGNLGKG